MAAEIRKLCVRALIFFIWASVRFVKDAPLKPVCAQGQHSLDCDTNSTEASGYHCNASKLQDRCSTFALFYSNSYFSSLSNLSFYLGLNRTGIAEASGLSMDTDSLLINQLLLIPLDCHCNGSFYQAGVVKTAIDGENLYGIAASLEGLTTCKAIRENNPSLPMWGLHDKDQLQIPLRCSCPTEFQLSQGKEIILSYPIQEGDTVPNLASAFNTTVESIVSANSISETLIWENLVTDSTLLIPLVRKPTLSSLQEARTPDLYFNSTNIPAMNAAENSPRRHKKTCKIGVYIAVSGAAVGLSVSIAIAIAAAVLVIQWKKKRHDLCKAVDVELRQLSIGNTCELKPVLKDPLKDKIPAPDTISNEAVVDTFTLEELRQATEDFNSSNQIEGSMFHGRLNGNNLAIRRTRAETISKIEFKFFDDTHRHPNIVRLLGTCLGDGCDSYLVFEYAKNGSLKDWLHGGLAMKSQFIASCYCFLTWKQRLRICLHVAVGLQYMHHTMNPSYVHRNIKSRNILLDEEFNAKIANFGMAKYCEGEAEDTQFLSSNPASWSKGYLAPELLEHGKITPSIDIFAYGVVLLEVLSGKTAINRAYKGESTRLSKQIKLILQSDNRDELRDWMDSALGEGYSFETAVTLAKLARACVEEDPLTRPSAEEITEQLARLIEELPDGENTSSYESTSKSQVNVA